MGLTQARSGSAVDAKTARGEAQPGDSTPTLVHQCSGDLKDLNYTSDTDSKKPRLGSVPGEDDNYPEGGVRAWLVVLGAWLALFAGLGLMNMLATYQTYVSKHQLANYDDGTIGWIFSLYVFVSFFLGIYVGPLFDKYGPRWLVMAGTVCLAVSQLLLSFSTG